VPRGSTGPGWVSAGRRDGFAQVSRGREDGDPLPGLGDRLGPWPVRGDLPASAASAADQAGGGVQDAVAQRLRLGCGKITVQGDQLEPAQQDLRDIAAVIQAWLTLKSKDRKRPILVSFPVRKASSTRAWTRWAASM
jgi:hypothetical protein